MINLVLTMKIVRYTTGKKSEYGPMQPGDTVEVKIEQIGTLKNYVV